MTPLVQQGRVACPLPTSRQATSWQISANSSSYVHSSSPRRPSDLDIFLCWKYPRTGQCDAGKICKDIFAGKELLDQAAPEIAAFCGGVGTAGMLMDVSRALKARGCRARIVALEPASSPVLTGGKGGPHRV